MTAFNHYNNFIWAYIYTIKKKLNCSVSHRQTFWVIEETEIHVFSSNSNYIITKCLVQFMEFFELSSKNCTVLSLDHILYLHMWSKFLSNGINFRLSFYVDNHIILYIKRGIWIKNCTLTSLIFLCIVWMLSLIGNRTVKNIYSKLLNSWKINYYNKIHTWIYD